MASIRKRGDGWRVQWRDPDGTQRSRQCPDQATAKELARDVEQCVARGVRWEPRDASPPPGLRAIFAEFLTACIQLGHDDRTIVHYGRYLEAFATFLESKDRRLRPELLTRDHLLEFLRHLQERPSPKKGNASGRTSLKTALKYTRAIERMWAWASTESDKYGDTVPAPKRLKLKGPPSAATLAPTWGDMDAMIAACSTLHHRQLGIIQRFTGLRISQAAAIRWDDLDLDRAILHVRPELGKMNPERSGRYVPISPHLVAHLRSWPKGDDGFVVRLEDGEGGRMEPRAREMATAWRNAGVPRARWRQPNHAFRKGFRSELTRAGALQEAIDFLEGHKLQGMRSVYTDPDALPLREAVKLIPPLKAVLLALEGGRAG
jgi:integrase